MRIGLIAMSGIRAENPELIKVGLTLPGVVERSRVVASLPSLSLLTIAGTTANLPDVQYQYFEVADLRAASALPTDIDLVAISSLSAQIDEAYAIADRYRAAGVPVVMGGLHVSALPDEAAQHCTAVAVGEGEPLWPRIVADARAGSLQPRYDAPPGAYFDLAHAPMPRFDLLDASHYNRFTVQTSRGCPHLCDFCASSVLLTPRYALKPVERVIAEIRQLKLLRRRPFIEFADDNSFSSRAHYKRLLAALREERVKWFTECDISIADDPELLDLMRASRCRQVLIGLESPVPDGLNGLELRRNWKLKQHSDYESAIRTIQSHGITVNGCFILGLDGHDASIFERVHQFVERSELYEVQITVLTPFPGTPLYERLGHEGRLLEPRNWRKCTLFDVNFAPTHMSVEALERGLIDLAQRLYEPGFVARRRQRFIERLAAQANPYL
ncbi:MAG: Hopanoid C-2 methylase [Phycisphaerae bacterium]|nr:Hopanoid C-2 methylase [Phycisphaerae bacterium]